MKIIKKVLAIIGVVVAVSLVAFLVLNIYLTLKNAERSVPFTLLNDTDEAVEVTACAGGGPQPPIEPRKSDTYYAYPSDPNAACGFYEVKRDKYLGCLLTPVTQGKRHTFRVSDADPSVKPNDCGLARTR